MSPGAPLPQTADAARRALHRLGDPDRAKFLQGFFKTGPGQYAHGDVFIGVVVPDTRKIAQRFARLPRTQITKLLRAKIHEERLLALLILTEQFAKGTETVRLATYRYYLRERRSVNNWDLVDTSAANIVGAHLFETGDNRAILYDLVNSDRMWDRRIAIVGTHYFIRKNDFGDTLRLAELLLGDTEDLMHKATGWMLREVGKRDVPVLKKFLNKHSRHMPRTALRYAIERFPEDERRRYLAR